MRPGGWSVCGLMPRCEEGRRYDPAPPMNTQARPAPVSLNNAQMQAVQHLMGPCLVLAGAGLVLGQVDKRSGNGLPVEADMARQPGKRYVFQLERASPLRLTIDGQARSLAVRAPRISYTYDVPDESVS